MKLTTPENVGVPVSVPDRAAALIFGLVSVLLVKISVVAFPTSVSAASGNVMILSAVEVTKNIVSAAAAASAAAAQFFKCVDSETRDAQTSCEEKRSMCILNKHFNRRLAKEFKE